MPKKKASSAQRFYRSNVHPMLVGLHSVTLRRQKYSCEPQIQFTDA